MIERVSRALCTAAGLDPNRWPEFQTQARAVLKAMREPTGAMVSAGNGSKPWNVVGYCEATVHPVCQRSWPAMIDAALDEPQDSGAPAAPARLPPAEAAHLMREAAAEYEPSNHLSGDRLLMRIASENGYGEAAEIFDGMSKWYE